MCLSASSESALGLNLTAISRDPRLSSARRILRRFRTMGAYYPCSKSSRDSDRLSPSTKVSLLYVSSRLFASAMLRHPYRGPDPGGKGPDDIVPEKHVKPFNGRHHFIPCGLHDLTELDVMSSQCLLPCLTGRKRKSRHILDRRWVENLAYRST